MNIRDALLEVHSKTQAEKICDYVGSDKKRFAELMRYMLGPVYRLSQRAAWPVSYCIERHPELVKPYWGKMLEQLERDDAHVAVRRNVARLLQFVEIPSRYRGRIFDACSSLVVDISQPIAVRCFSLTVAVNIAKGKPELMNELKLLVMEHGTGGSPGFQSRIRRYFGAR